MTKIIDIYTCKKCTNQDLTCHESNTTMKCWYKKKNNYYHFDKQIKNKIHYVYKNLNNESALNFYPFIRFKQIKIKRKGKNEFRTFEKKDRPLVLTSHLLTPHLHYANFILTQYYENYINTMGLHDNILAYRSLGKNNIDFFLETLKSIFDLSKNKDIVVLLFDIKGFFDNIDKNTLKNNIFSLDISNKNYYNKIVNSITNYSILEADIIKDIIMSKSLKQLSSMELQGKEMRSFIDQYKIELENRHNNETESIIKIEKQKAGIPQGTVISALFSNIYMKDFDVQLKSSNDVLLYRRYSDDIVIAVDMAQEDLITDIIQSYLDKLSLKLNNDKTEKVIFCNKKIKKVQGYKKQFIYLGLEYNNKHILLKSRTIARYYSRMYTTIKKAHHIVNKKNYYLNKANENMSKEYKLHTSIKKKACKKKFTQAIKKKEKEYGNFVNYSIKAHNKVGKFCAEKNIINGIKKQIRNKIKYINSRKVIK